MIPEFSRPVRVDSIGDRPVAIEADERERQALATRFGLVAIERLAASFAFRRDGAAIVAEGRVAAMVTQACSVTADPLPATVDETVSLRFAEEAAAGDEIELEGEAIDTLPIEGGAIDLGEAAAETMALALDPFPRGPGAAAALAEAGVIGEEEAARRSSPFAGLKDALSSRRDRG